MAVDEPRELHVVPEASDLSSSDLCDGDEQTRVDPWAYEPPKVSYEPIYDEVTTILPTGEHKLETKVVGYVVNPAFGRDWPEIKTLQHFAALIEHRTGHKVRVIATTVGREDDSDDGWVDEEGYEVMTDHCITGSPAPYEVTYAWLSGFENGIHEILWAKGGSVEHS